VIESVFQLVYGLHCIVNVRVAGEHEESGISAGTLRWLIRSLCVGGYEKADGIVEVWR